MSVCTGCDFGADSSAFTEARVCAVRICFGEAVCATLASLRAGSINAGEKASAVVAGGLELAALAWTCEPSNGIGALEKLEALSLGSSAIAALLPWEAVVVD